MENFINYFGQSLAYVLLGIFIFFAGKFIKDILTPFNDDKELTEKDNPALGLSVMGYYLGIMIIYIGATLGPAISPDAYLTNEEYYKDVGIQLGITAIWSFAGIFFLNIARGLLDKVNLRGVPLAKEIINDKNMGAGAIEFGSYIASALIIAASIYGETGNWVTAVLFFVLGQSSLIVFTALYQKITPFDIISQINKDNNAVGVALAGNLIAIGLVVAGAATVPFETWDTTLVDFGINLGLGIVFLLIGRFVADKVLLPGTSLNHEIENDRNVAAAFIESAAVISFAALIFILI